MSLCVFPEQHRNTFKKAVLEKVPQRDLRSRVPVGLEASVTKQGSPAWHDGPSWWPKLRGDVAMASHDFSWDGAADRGDSGRVDFPGNPRGVFPQPDRLDHASRRL